MEHDIYPKTMILFMEERVVHPLPDPLLCKQVTYLRIPPNCRLAHLHIPHTLKLDPVRGWPRKWEVQCLPTQPHLTPGLLPVMRSIPISC